MAKVSRILKHRASSAVRLRSVGMRAARIHEYGGPDVIRVEDLPQPVPGPGEVLIRVAATSLNPTETALRSGVLATMLPIELPVTLGWDVAGTVDGEPV